MRDVVICETPEDVADAAADLIFREQTAAIAARGLFRIALSGGSVLRLLYEALASAEWRDAMDWPNWEIFFSDERAVPPDYPESNFRLAHEALLAHVEIGNIWRMTGAATDPRAAADDYARTLRSRLGPGLPVLDVILLGIGADGHTASLFPGHPALESRALVEAVEVNHSIPRRLTLTLAVLNRARHTIFLVAGAEKAERVREVLVHNNPLLPAGRVLPDEGMCTWILDHEAARLIR